MKQCLFSEGSVLFWYTYSRGAALGLGLGLGLGLDERTPVLWQVCRVCQSHKNSRREN